MHLNHPQTILLPVLEKIVFYETNLWCQNCWGPLKQRICLKPFCLVLRIFSEEVF